MSGQHGGQKFVPPVQHGSKQAIPNEPPAFLDLLKEKGFSKELLTDELAQPHVYLIIILIFAIIVAIIIGASGA
ncbi:MAG: hypothetical protein L0Z54_01895 [Thermoplasmata archaeon]|nr:hypothetical protein [Thermoplasmata archaeon]